MKRFGHSRVYAAAVALVILAVAGVAEADYLIILRNGKEITVSRYEDQGDKIVYKRYGGKISISKTTIEAIKDLNTGKKRIFDGSGISQEPKATPQVTHPPAQASPSEPQGLDNTEVLERYYEVWERYYYGGIEAYKQGRHAEAEKRLRAAVKEAEKFGVDNPSNYMWAASIGMLGKLYATQGKYAEAERDLRRSLPILERFYGLEHEAIVVTLVNLGDVYHAQGKYAEAEQAWRRAILLQEDSFGPDHALMAYALKGFRAAFDAREKALGRDHPEIGDSLNFLGLRYLHWGQYTEAERLLRQALTIREKALGAEHPDVGWSLNNLAILYARQDQFAKAQPLWVRSVAIFEKALGPEHPEVGTILASLGKTYVQQEKYAQAEPLYRRAVAIREKSPGNYRGLATSLESFATVLRKTNRAAEARRVEVRAKKAWATHANYLNQKAGYLQRQGKPEEALMLLRQATEVTPEDPLTHMNYASVLFAKGNFIHQAGDTQAAGPIFKEVEKELSLTIQLTKAKRGGDQTSGRQLTPAQRKWNLGQSYFLLGDIYYYVYRDKAKAKILYQNALKHKPDHPMALRAIKTRFK